MFREKPRTTAENALKRKNPENESAEFNQRKSKRIAERNAHEMAKTSNDDESKSPTYNRFMQNVKEELERINDNDDNDDYCVSTESLTKLCKDVFELKKNGEIYHFGKNEMTILIDAAMRSVDAAKQISFGSHSEHADIEKSMDKILAATEASLLICHLYSTSKKTKSVPNENMEKIVKFVDRQMRETIFPIFDRFFATEFVEKFEKLKSINVAIDKISLLYEKLIAIIGIFERLFVQNAFTDPVLKGLLAVSVKSLFVDKIAAVQDVCIDLITTIFRSNTSYRKQILTNIQTLIERMPLSKRNFERKFEIAPNSENIHMVTAVVLLLIQNSVNLPANVHAINAIIDAKIMKNWQIAATYIRNFVKLFYEKCANRHFFETFLNDLLKTAHCPEWPASNLLLIQLGDTLMKVTSNKKTVDSMRIFSLKCLGTITAEMRKSVIESQKHGMKRVIERVQLEHEKKDKEKNACGEDEFVIRSEGERIAFLQNILLDFLAANDDPMFSVARKFIWTKLFRDVVVAGENEFASIDEKKDYLLSKMLPNPHDEKIHINYADACKIAQYLTGKQEFLQRSSEYFIRIQMMHEPVRIQIQAINCLAMVAKVDPFILKRNEMPANRIESFPMAPISVRASIIHLIGKCVLKLPGLIDDYYGLLSMGIRDTGIMVRKQTIKIFRDICIKYPNFDKIPEICVEMIKCANEHAANRKSIEDAFIKTWLTPCASNEKESIQMKINQMLDVVGMYREVSLKWFNDLWTDSMDANDIVRMRIGQAFQQISDGLIGELKKVDALDCNKALSCVQILHLLAKIQPTLVIKHVTILQSYLDVDGNSPTGIKLECCTAALIEELVPQMELSSKALLSDLEMHLIFLVVSKHQDVLQTYVSCLSTVIKMTNNYALIRHIVKCSQTIIHTQVELQSNASTKNVFQPKFVRRNLLMNGLVFRFFDFTQTQVCGDMDMDAEEVVRNDVFEQFSFCAKLIDYTEIRRDALIALGHFCITNFHFLLNPKLRDMYCDILTSEKCDENEKITVLRNVTMYLSEADVSDTSLQICRIYLDEIVYGFLNANKNVRLASLEVVQQILRNGRQEFRKKIIPFLICLSTDNDRENVSRVNRHLKNIFEENPREILMQSQLGMQLSFRLQTIHQNVESKMETVRGFTVKKNNEQPIALNGFLYTLVRPNENYRRLLIDSIINQFMGDDTTIQHMLYLADNLEYFPYVVRDEPLYVLDEIANVIMVIEEDPRLGMESDEDDPINREEFRDGECNADSLHERLELLTALERRLQAMYNITHL